MLGKLFPHIKPKTLQEKVYSRDAFIYLDRVMWSFGWTEPKEKRWKWLYGLWTLTTTIVVLILLPISMVVSYVDSFHSFSAGEFLSSLEICVNIYGCCLKCAFLMRGHLMFQEAKKFLDRLDESCHGDEENLTMRRYVAWGNFCYIIYHILYWGFVFVNFTGYILIRRHAWRMYNPFLDSEENFYSSSFAEFFLMSAVVTMDQCTDVSPLTHVLMARCHITLLKDRLSRLRRDIQKSEDEHYSDLTKCIKDHRLILEYINVLRPVFSGTIFVQFLLIGIVLGLSAINLMFFSTFWTGLGTLCFMFDVCLETFPLCYLCNVIVDDCQQLSDTLFQSNWLSADRRYKSTLVYFLHNLQRPIILMAGGVFQICMQTNLSMVKLAFSVVTVMKQFNLAEKFQ
ncbi:odorant receptor 22a-like [Drosophila bipectinata]|uniref:odorant receptor 22a-like n=1 Tax=Drosophila bipectinata TaxID=42026 RepID=UPI001C89E6C1|nr:odorant receptor 22a-like [Drosophila bipectinata]